MCASSMQEEEKIFIDEDSLGPFSKNFRKEKKRKEKKRKEKKKEVCLMPAEKKSMTVVGLFRCQTFQPTRVGREWEANCQLSH